MDVIKITMSKFTNIELAILKRLHKEFTLEDLNTIVVKTISTTSPYWDVEKKYLNLMKLYGLMPEPNQYGGYGTDKLTQLTKYAKWTVDNLPEATDPYDESVDFRRVENPSKPEMKTYEVSASESGSQVLYRSGWVEILAWNQDDAEDKGVDDFYDWGGEMEDDDYGDWYGDGIELDDITVIEEIVKERVIKEGRDPNDGFVVHHNLPEDKMIKIIDKAVNKEILPSKIIGGGTGEGIGTDDEGTVEITKVIYNSIQFHDDGLHVYVTAFGVEDIFRGGEYEGPLKGYDKMWKGVSDYDIIDDLYDMILSPYTYRYIGVDKDSEIKAYVELWLDGEDPGPFKKDSILHPAFELPNLNEHIPQPGSSSAEGIKDDTLPYETQYLTLDEILTKIKSIPYYNEVLDDLKDDKEDWAVTQTVKRYAKYWMEHPESLTSESFPPKVILANKN